MRQDIIRSIRAHAAAVMAAASGKSSRGMPVGILVYWPVPEGVLTKEITYDAYLSDESDDKDLDTILILQDILLGRSKWGEHHLGSILSDCGSGLVAENAGLLPDPMPMAITVSAYAIMTTNEPEYDESGETAKINGRPVLLVAGRNADADKTHVEFWPVPTDEQGRIAFNVPIQPPDELVRKLEAAKELATDFLGPFFAAVRDNL